MEEASEWEGEEGIMEGIEERLPSSAQWWFSSSVELRVDSVRLCKDVESSSQGRSWKAGGKGGRRGAPLQVGNQDSSPGSQPVNPSRLAADNSPEESSIGKSGKLWWECGGGDQQLSILLKLQTAPLPSFFSCFASFQQQSQACLLLNPLDGTDRHGCNCCQLAPTGPAAQSNNVSAAY